MSENILINYEGANQHSVSAGPSDLVRLNPGVNPVDADAWGRIIDAAEKEAKATGKRSGVLYLLDNDLVSEVPATAEGGGVDLDKMNATEAISIVQGEVDLDVLVAMLAGESDRSKPRATVVKVIETQISDLEDALDGGNE